VSGQYPRKPPRHIRMANWGALAAVAIHLLAILNYLARSM
jgi:hypothetical protein